MTQEDKQLLLKDLCMRLPYGIIGEYSWKGKKPYNKKLTGNLYDELNSSWSSTEDSKFIPYLRSMSSMTEEERMEFEDICTTIAKDRTHFVMEGSIDSNYMLEKFYWLIKNHFDYNGLISKGLAIEITKDNDPYKNS